jgi:hypothetical protein
MKHLSATLALLVLSSSLGCAGIATQRAHDVSSAGLAYSAAAQELMDAAMAAVVDADSFSKIATKTPPGDPKPSPEKLRAELKESNDELVTTLTRYQQLRTSMATLGAYFSALQELADHPQGDATAKAVETLGKRINDLDGVLTKDKELAISDEQVKAASALGKLVSDQVHGAVVAAALERDAEPIGRALATSGKAVALAEKHVSAYLRLEQGAFRRERVEKPFVSQSMDDQWMEDRRTYLKAVALGKGSAEIGKAEAASKQMEETWKKVLAGDLTVVEIHTLIGEIDQLLRAADTLKTATQPKPPPTS